MGLKNYQAPILTLAARYLARAITYRISWEKFDMPCLSATAWCYETSEVGAWKFSKPSTKKGESIPPFPSSGLTIFL
jgi:hypothetical protein